MARPADPNTKIDLLRAAEAVFAERGLDNAKVEEITERAGHSKGSFYLHFGSKEDAFRQIVESTLARLATCLDAGEIDKSVRLPPAEHVEEWRAHDLEMFEFIWANR
ncbi:MAG TPA: helix-turn-helix domain-containing protein, partial [Polyangia bacterium]